jgi:hypothetical protein
MNKPKCISYMVSAMEAVSLLLCVTHTTEHLRHHTEPCGSFARANAKRKQQRGGECFGVSSAAKLKYEGTQKYKATVNTTDRNGEFCTMVGKMGPRHVGTCGWLIIWHPGRANNFASLETDVL